MAILPTIVMASNPFQSGSSLSNLEARQKALDFKLRLLVYYFNQSPPGRRPPGLPVSQDIQPLQGFTMQCMVSKLSLDSNIVTAAHILPKASSRVSFVLYLWYATERYVTLTCLQWGDCVLGIDDVWDERNGLLWAEPFEKVSQRHFDKLAIQFAAIFFLHAGVSCPRDSSHVPTNFRHLQMSCSHWQAHGQKVVWLWPKWRCKVRAPQLEADQSQPVLWPSQLMFSLLQEKCRSSTTYLCRVRWYWSTHAIWPHAISPNTCSACSILSSSAKA